MKSSQLNHPNNNSNINFIKTTRKRKTTKGKRDGRKVFMSLQVSVLGHHQEAERRQSNTNKRGKINKKLKRDSSKKRHQSLDKKNRNTFRKYKNFKEKNREKKTAFKLKLSI